mmetsp:Transcript_32607/g.96105  ORF Transcript_32607/g.96105 Transcript_32607/m.96105 type:complete len:532 (-) Transcript_32607:43-1638(-)
MAPGAKEDLRFGDDSFDDSFQHIHVGQGHSVGMANNVEARKFLPYALIVAGLIIIIGGGIAFALVDEREPAAVRAASEYSHSSIAPGDDETSTSSPTFRYDTESNANPVHESKLEPSIFYLPTSQPTTSTTAAEPTPIPSNVPVATEQPTKRNTYHTIIVGAGAAGLAAAYTLQNEGSKLSSDRIHVLESADTLGGRVQKSTTFAPYPLDLGASFVQYDDEIEAIVGVDRLAKPDNTGLPIFVNYTWWDFFNDIIAPKDKENVIEYGCRVVVVDYLAFSTNDDDNAIMTQCDDGRSFFSHHVITTVPLSILRDGVIDFRPPLPRSMTTFHPGLPVWEGFKIFLEVRKANFLDESHIESIAPDGYLTETGENLFWKLSSVHETLENGNEIIAGYLLGDQSHPFIDLDDEAIIQEILELLDDQYDGEASRFYVRGFVKNWSKDANVRGTLSTWGYDKPVDEGGPGYPSGAQNIYNSNKVWIAGEAFPIDGSNGWVDSGAFSGDEAARQIIELTQGTKVGPDLFWTRVKNNLSI